MDITLETISALDWVTLTDVSDPENTAEMEVMNVAEMLTGESDTGLFLLISGLDDDLDEESEEEADEAEAFIFKVCEEEQAEFVLTDMGGVRIYLTTAIEENEYMAAADLFMDTTADFDIAIDTEENE